MLLCNCKPNHHISDSTTENNDTQEDDVVDDVDDVGHDDDHMFGRRKTGMYKQLHGFIQYLILISVTRRFPSLYTVWDK